MIDRYLHEVDSYLHVDRAHRPRVLDEIEGHLHDAVEAHVARGAQADQAMKRAIEELGSPADVAVQFSPPQSPSRSVRGWRRWAPMALPTALLTIGVVLSAWSVTWLSAGLTLGEERVLRFYLTYTAIFGVLTIGTYAAVRNADRDPAWRRAAWIFAGLAGVLLAVAMGG